MVPSATPIKSKTANTWQPGKMSITPLTSHGAQVLASHTSAAAAADTRGGTNNETPTRACSDLRSPHAPAHCSCFTSPGRHDGSRQHDVHRARRALCQQRVHIWDQLLRTWAGQSVWPGDRDGRVLRL